MRQLRTVRPLKTLYVRARLITALLGVALSAAVTAEPSSIAAVTALSGDLAIIGTALKNGIELACERHPDLFRKISIQFHDTQFDPAQDLAVYRLLTTVTARPKVILNFGLLAVVTGDRLHRDALPVIDFNFI